MSTTTESHAAHNEAAIAPTADSVTDAAGGSSSRRRQRQNTPQLRQQSASLTRRQMLLETVEQQRLRGTPSGSRQGSASPGTPLERASSALGSPAVVCGVRSSFPLVPAVAAGGSAEHKEPETAGRENQSSAASATAATAAVVVVAGEAATQDKDGVQEGPRRPNANTRGKARKPPRGRPNVPAVESDDDDDHQHHHHQLHDSSRGPAAITPKSTGVTKEVMQPLTSTAHPTSSFRQRRASSQVAVTEVRKAAVTAMASDRDARRSIHGGGGALHQEEEKPVQVERTHRSSMYLVGDAKGSNADVHTRPELLRRASEQRPIESASTVEVRKAAVTAMTADRDARRSIHGGGGALRQEEEKPVQVERTHRSSMYLTAETKQWQAGPVHVKPEMARRASVKVPAEAVKKPRPSMEDAPVAVVTRRRSSAQLATSQPSSRKASLHVKADVAHRPSVSVTPTHTAAAATAKEAPMTAEKRRRSSQHLPYHNTTSPHAAAKHKSPQTTPELLRRASEQRPIESASAVEVRKAAVTAMTADRDARRSIHGGGGALHQEEEKPVQVERTHRSSMYLVGDAKGSNADVHTRPELLRRASEQRPVESASTVEVRKAAVTAMTADRDARRSIHGGGGALHQEEEKPVQVERTHRSSMYLVGDAKGSDADVHTRPELLCRASEQRPVESASTVEVRKAAVTAMTADRDARRSIHGGGGALHQEEEKPVQVERTHRSSMYLVGDAKGSDADVHTRPELLCRASEQRPVESASTVEVRKAAVTAMTADRDARRSIHGGGGALHQEEEKPVQVERTHRSSMYLVGDAKGSNADVHTRPELLRRASEQRPVESASAVEVRKAAVTAMTADRDARRSIHGGGGALRQEEEKPAEVERKHRLSRRMTNLNYNTSSTTDCAARGLPVRQDVASQASVDPATVEVRRAGEAAVFRGHEDARHSIHGGGGALEESAELPMEADVRRRSTQVLDVPPAEQRRHASQTRLQQPSVDPRPVSSARPNAAARPIATSSVTDGPSRRHSKHAAGQQAPVYSDADRSAATMTAVSAHVLQAARTAAPHQQQAKKGGSRSRHSVHGAEADVQQPMPVTTRAIASASQRVQADTRRRSSHHATSAGQPWFAPGQEKPSELHTVAPQTIAAAAPSPHSSADPSHARKRSVHSAFAEAGQSQREAALQTQPTHVVVAAPARTSAAGRRESRHAVDSAAPHFADGDEKATELQTVAARSLAAKSPSAPPRHSIHGQPLAEAVADVQATHTSPCPPRTLSAPQRPAVLAETRSHSLHGALTVEEERGPVAPLKAAALSQPLGVVAGDGEESADIGGGDDESVPPRRTSRHAAHRDSAYSPVVPTRQRVHSAPLPHPRRSLHPSEGGEEEEGEGAEYTKESRLSSLSEPDSSADAAGQPQPEKTVKDAAADSDVDAGGKKKSREPSLFSYGSVDVARDIRGFYAGGSSDDAEDDDDHDEYEEGDADESNDSDESFLQQQKQADLRRVTKLPEREDDDSAAASVAERSSPRSGRRRRTTLVTAVDVDEVSRSKFTVGDGARLAAPFHTNADYYDDVEEEEEEEEEEDGEYEMISCYDVSCQTSEYLYQEYLDQVREEEEEKEARDEEHQDQQYHHANEPHYVGSNRWMCALGLCPVCHPGHSSRKAHSGQPRHGHHHSSSSSRSQKGESATHDGASSDRVRSVWPVVARGSLGYSAPPRLTRPLPHIPRCTAVSAAAPATSAATTARQQQQSSSRTPQLPYLTAPSSRGSARGTGAAPSRRPDASSARLPAAAHSTPASGSSHSTATSRSGTVASTATASSARSWDLRQRQRQRQLRDLQREHSLGCSGGGAAFGHAPRLLTSHDMQCGLPMAEYAYRYCDLASERMMVHRPIGTRRWRVKGDAPLEDYNDTLYGAPLLTRPADDGEASTSRPCLTMADDDEGRPRLTQLSVSKKHSATRSIHSSSGGGGGGAADKAIVSHAAADQYGSSDVRSRY